MSKESEKQCAAKAAIDAINPWLDSNTVIGVGSGSTVAYFIEYLSHCKSRLAAAVASSIETERLLKQQGIPVIDLNTAPELPFYVDGADEFDPHLNLIKGGGGALTREKIIAACAKEFICIADHSKRVSVLGKFPLPVEVIPMARSSVARALVKLRGNPSYREGFTTDNGNIILDIYDLNIAEPLALESNINNITGVVTVGLFAQRRADKVLMANKNTIEIIKPE